MSHFLAKSGKIFKIAGDSRKCPLKALTDKGSRPLLLQSSLQLKMLRHVGTTNDMRGCLKLQSGLQLKMLSKSE